MLGAKTEILIDRQKVKDKLEDLGEQISKDYQGRKILLICVLKGAVVFLADLLRVINIPAEIDFIAVSSYGASTISSGVVKIIKDLDRSIEGEDILIVEDIIDTGLTLKYLQENLMSRNPRSLKIVTLLDKPERRQVELVPDYVGFTIPDLFIVGYGLDYNQKYRQLPDICVLNSD